MLVETICSKSADDTSTPDITLTFSINDFAWSLFQPFPVARPANLASITSSLNSVFQSVLPVLSPKCLFDSRIFMISDDFSTS